MNGAAPSAAGETCTVVVERDFAYPPEKIWRALTQPHLLAAWLMQNDFQAAVGHRFTLRKEPRPDFHIAVDCKVLAVEPHKMLSYTWDAMGLASVVTFTLTPTTTPTGGGTRVRMEQTGFTPDRPQNIAGAKAGWKRMLGDLETVLARIE